VIPAGFDNWLDRQFPLESDDPPAPDNDVVGALVACLIGAAITGAWCALLWWAVRKWVIGE
jgi:hypothetical protein